MKNKVFGFRALSCFVSTLLCLQTLGFAQQPIAGGQADVPSLVGKLNDKDERTVLSAAQAFIAIRPSVIPALVDVLGKERGCQLQFVASGVIYKLEPRHAIVNSTLIGITRGECKESSRNSLIIRRQAAFALVGKAEGIQVIAGMLKDKDTFVRRSAAFAFDELTERIEGRPPEVTATPEIVGAIKAALPLLMQAVDDKDEVVRCMSYESLEQIQRSKHEALRTEANRLVQGMKPRCSS